MMGSADAALTFSWVGSILKKAVESGTLTFADIARYGQEIRPMWCALAFYTSAGALAMVHMSAHSRVSNTS